MDHGRLMNINNLITLRPFANAQAGSASGLKYTSKMFS